MRKRNDHLVLLLQLLLRCCSCYLSPPAPAPDCYKKRVLRDGILYTYIIRRTYVRTWCDRLYYITWSKYLVWCVVLWILYIIICTRYVVLFFFSSSSPPSTHASHKISSWRRFLLIDHMVIRFCCLYDVIFLLGVWNFINFEIKYVTQLWVRLIVYTT